MNKDAGKVMKAVGSDYSSCLKSFAKGDEPSMEACVLKDLKGKRGKALAGLDDKAGSICEGGNAPLFGFSSAATAGRVSLDKELGLLRAVFGSDLDSGDIVTADPDKPGSQCQGAVWKAMQKCLDTKMKMFGACAKNVLKGNAPATSPIDGRAELEGLCLVGGIDDPKGKIPGKCLEGISGAISKKCGGLTLSTYFPGPGGSTAADLDETIECEVCKALNGIHDLHVNCDEFDDGVANGSCEAAIGFHLSVYDDSAHCEGGLNDQDPCSESLLAAPNDCPDGVCVADASHSVIRNANGAEIPFLLSGNTSVSCGVEDPVTGVAPCECRLENLEGQDLSLIGFICFEPVNDLCPKTAAPPGRIDCDGGTPMDQDMQANHDVAPLANAADPVTFPIPICGLGLPPWLPGTENLECEAMCDSYCASLGPAYLTHESGCEGYCATEANGDDSDGGLACVNHSDCPNNDCAGGSLGAPHQGACQCECVAQGIGAPGRPGSMMCQTGLQSTIEFGPPCDSDTNPDDIHIIIVPACIPVTTETSTATLLNANAIGTQTVEGQTQVGDPGSGCDGLRNDARAGSRLAGHVANFESTIGDVITRTINQY